MSRGWVAMAALALLSSCRAPDRINSPFTRTIEDDGTTNCTAAVAERYEKWATHNDLSVDGEREENRLALYSQVPDHDLFVELYYRVRHAGTELSLALTQATSAPAPEGKEVAKQYRLADLWIDIEQAARCGSE